MRAWRASGGYTGGTLRIRSPDCTPDETRTRCGVAIFGTATGVELRTLPITPPIEPPGTPPGTPPTTPVEAMAGGGASSSLIIWTFFGILVGVRSSPFTISVSICFTIFTGAAAGGGGGGGGGGATRNVINCVLGKASVKISGMSTITPIIMTCSANETSDVHPRLVLSLPPDSIRLSSNMVNLPKLSQTPTIN